MVAIMSEPRLVRAFPNEQTHIILEFAGHEYRIFDVMTLYHERGWTALAYPRQRKSAVLSEAGLTWPGIGSMASAALYGQSQPLDQDAAARQSIRISYMNQAPTRDDAGHHVVGVFLMPYSARPFCLDESIGGGRAERGGGQVFTIDELRAWPMWRRHFARSGCAWAIGYVDALAGQPARLIDALIGEACRRNGLPDGC
jgi:hypothetical protein